MEQRSVRSAAPPRRESSRPGGCGEDCRLLGRAYFFLGKLYFSSSSIWLAALAADAIPLFSLLRLCFSHGLHELLLVHRPGALRTRAQLARRGRELVGRRCAFCGEFRCPSSGLSSCGNGVSLHLDLANFAALVAPRRSRVRLNFPRGPKILFRFSPSIRSRLASHGISATTWPGPAQPFWPALRNSFLGRPCLGNRLRTGCNLRLVVSREGTVSHASVCLGTLSCRRRCDMLLAGKSSHQYLCRLDWSARFSLDARDGYLRFARSRLASSAAMVGLWSFSSGCRVFSVSVSGHRQTRSHGSQCARGCATASCGHAHCRGGPPSSRLAH